MKEACANPFSKEKGFTEQTFKKSLIKNASRKNRGLRKVLKNTFFW